jgi:predicted metalloprotease with PDZ domain
MTRLSACVALIVLAFCSRLSAVTPVRYFISLSDPAHHILRITVRVPRGADTVELQLPVWNALYQVRDFSQFLRWIRAEDSNGRALAITQINPSRWEISGAKDGAQINYEMFSDTPGPFGTQLNSHHSFLNLAEILIYVPELRNDPQELEFGPLPQDWKIATALKRDGKNFTAISYDQLVDSPVEVSKFSESTFTQSCGKYRVVVDSEHAPEILSRIIPPIQKLVGEATRWMDDCPFDLYTFIYHFSDSPARGGMEHANATAITVPLKSLDGTMDVFTGMTAHEFFHLWNVKRIRPQTLEPIDYTRENYSSSLWFSEGVDSTAADCIRRESGLLDETRYLANLGEEITELQNRPAHLMQSAEQSSLDAWLEKYPYYGLPDRSISYYTKGNLLGVLLDLKMRQASDDRASLKMLFRSMNEHYAQKGKYFDDSAAVRAMAEELSGADLRGFFTDYVSGVREIPWNEFFAYVGLQVVRSELTIANRGFNAVQKFDQPMVVQVEAGSLAERAGLRGDDVVVKVNGQPAGRDFEKRIDAIGPGGLLQLRINRDGIQRDLQWKLEGRNQTIYRLADVPNVSAEQKHNRAMWLFDQGSTAP